MGAEPIIKEAVDRWTPHLLQWRRHLHRHPELSFHERDTARYLVDNLADVKNLTVTTEVAGTHGLVATIGQGSGVHVAFRADMDALPLDESGTDPWRSQRPGVMHACGHDAHMSIALGALHVLADIWERESLNGAASFIFQPAEETPDDRGKTGAPYLVDAGVLDGIDVIGALHMDPQQPVGVVRLHDGACMASVDNFRLTIIGRGGHAGYPHLTVDPLAVMVPTLQAINVITARRVSAMAPAVVSVCRVVGGTTNNVIPDIVEIEGTVRTYDGQVREHVLDELARACDMVKNMGAQYELDIQRCEPPTFNDRRVNQILEQAALASGLVPLWDGPFGMGGEDFGFMTAKVPGALAFIGCAADSHTKGSLHSSNFDLDERVLPLGVTLVVEAMRMFLRGGWSAKEG